MIYDLIEAIKAKDLWLYLGWHDVVAKYKRTSLGPFWSIIITAISIGCMAILGAALFKSNLKTFLPYVACGMVVWGYISMLIMESCVVFLQQSDLLQNTRLPILSFVLRMFLRNTIVFCHSLVILFIVITLTGYLSFKVILIIPAILICAVNAVSIGVILGFLTSRYRDIQYMVQSLLNILMLITPIMWKSEMLGEYKYLFTYNPFTHFIEIFRAPLLGAEIATYSVEIVLAITIITFSFASYLYNSFKHRLVFWL